jgi:hypothetical protein
MVAMMTVMVPAIVRPMSAVIVRAELVRVGVIVVVVLVLAFAVRRLASMCVVAHRVVALLAVGGAHAVQDGAVRAPAQALMRRGSPECGNRRSR